MSAHERASRCVDQRGLTLAEILAAMFIIGIGIVGLAVVMPISSYGVQEGNQLSTATFLAEERIEQVRNAYWTASPDNDCIGTGTAAAPTVPVGKTCTDPATGATVYAAGAVTFADDTPSGFSGYSRTVRITDCAAGCGSAPYTITDGRIRLVTATVTYRPLAVAAGAPTSKSATISLLIAKR